MTGVQTCALPILTGRRPGDPPPTLFEYLPPDALCIVDESHVTVPQIGGMYEGDASRKRTLVEHGFRLPSAMDNRPLKFDEFVERIGQTVYLSATPGPYEMERATGVVEQIIRAHGGTAAFARNAPRGAKAVLVLPVTEDPAAR